MNDDANTSTGAAAKQKQSIAEMARSYVRADTRSQAATATTAETANIQANGFYKTVIDESLSPSEKKNAMVALLTNADGKDAAREAVEELEAFKAYLQEHRKEMARQIIKLTDTETFGELKDVYSQINDDLLDFEDKIEPLTVIVDALHRLRMNGITIDVYEEIKRDREQEAKLEAQREEQAKRLETARQRVRDLRVLTEKLKNEKRLFGLLGPSKTTLDQIAENAIALEEAEADIVAIEQEIEETARLGMPPSEYAEFAEEKAKLRELLDISSDDHKARQEDLVRSAADFVDSTEERVGAVLGHFDGMNGQIDRLGDANYQMRSIYAILNDATREAIETNGERRENLAGEMEGKSEIEKMQQEEVLRVLQNHIQALGKSDVDTTRVFVELTEAGHRVQAMKENNDQQVSNTRALHTSGVAGVADQLSTVLQAVSAAALGEASAAAKMTMQRMRDTTSEISGREAFRAAAGHGALNEELSRALSDFEDFGDVVRAVNQVRNEGLAENRRLLDRLEETAGRVQETIQAGVEDAASIVAGKGGAGEAPEDGEAEEAPAKPLFDIGGDKS